MECMFANLCLSLTNNRYPLHQKMSKVTEMEIIQPMRRMVMIKGQVNCKKDLLQNRGIVAVQGTPQCRHHAVHLSIDHSP